MICLHGQMEKMHEKKIYDWNFCSYGFSVRMLSASGVVSDPTAEDTEKM